MLTQLQKTTLKNDVLNNNITIVNFNDGQPIAIKLILPNTQNGVGDNFERVANWYNQLTSSVYWVWRSIVSRVDIYKNTSDLPSNWVWLTYKGQSVTEQGAWVQMFMGDQCDMSALNNRVGVDDIFGGNANGNAQRSHIFAISRRLITNFEKLFVTASTTQANKITGNDGIVGNRGKITNPDTAGFQGMINADDLFDALLNG